ncbi:MAG: hypothetical protein M0Z31_08555 [Clostridia bacterium]|nr:hypothetical protein [Clostridia bacterium]
MVRRVRKMVLVGLLVLVTIIGFGVYMATEAFNSLVAPPEPVRALRVELVKEEGLQAELLGYQVKVDIKPLANKIREGMPEWVPTSGEVEVYKAEARAAVEKGRASVEAWWAKVKEMTQEKLADNSH